LEVIVTDVTEQWAQIVVAGPKSRDVLARCVFGAEVDNAHFPHLGVQEAQIADMRARIFRASFTGELAYEIAVPAKSGCRVWDALLEAGEPFSIAPYGLIASNILRMEKGYMLVGEDTYGGRTPGDMGLSWAVSNQKEETFIGERALALKESLNQKGLEFVGLLSEDANAVLPPGCPIVEDGEGVQPHRVVGHVTSSQFSVAIGRSMALALLEDGRRHMQKKVRLLKDGTAISAVVVTPCQYDTRNEKMNA
jgi:sarcosine oxidase subunit alpha